MMKRTIFNMSRIFICIRTIKLYPGHKLMCHHFHVLVLLSLIGSYYCSSIRTRKLFEISPSLEDSSSLTATVLSDSGSGTMNVWERVKEVFFQWGDSSEFDFFGNELVGHEAHDFTLPKGHSLCSKYENTHETFRRFAGLLGHFAGEKCVDFSKLNDLISLINYEEFNYEEIGKEIDHRVFTANFNSQAYWSKPSSPSDASPKEKAMAVKTQTYFPLLYCYTEDLHCIQLSELIVVDLLLVLFPNSIASYLYSRVDASVMLLSLFLVSVPDLSDHWQDFLDLVELLRSFSGEEIIGISTSKSREELLEALFRKCLHGSLPFSLEAFYSYEMQLIFDFSSIFQLIVKESAYPVILVRFFHLFFSLKAEEEVLIFDEAIQRHRSALHYILTHVPEKFPLLFQFPEMMSFVDWSVGEFGSEEGGPTILWILLNYLKPFFDFEGDFKKVSLMRSLLTEFIIQQQPLHLLTHRKPDRDLLDECLKDDESLRFMSFYADKKILDALLPSYLERVLQIWRDSVLLVGDPSPLPPGLYKTFKFLLFQVSKTNSRSLTPILQDLFYFFLAEQQQQHSPSQPPKTKSLRSRSQTRSLSSEYLKSFLRVSKSETNLDLNSGSGVITASTASTINSDLLRWLCEAAMRSGLSDNELAVPFSKCPEFHD